MAVDVVWDGGKLSNATFRVDAATFILERQVKAMYDGTMLKSFVAQEGLEVVVSTA